MITVFSDLPPDELLKVCLGGSEQEAWREFVRRYHPVIAANVIRIARQYRVSSASMIEDLIQEVYLRLCDRDHRILREFRCERPDALYSFLKVVTANLVRDRCNATLSAKRGSGRVVSLSSDRNALPVPAEFSNQVELEIFLERVEQALKTIVGDSSAARDRSIFWLYYRQGLTAREIAAIPAFGLTPKGIESLLNRLVRDVRTALLRDRGELPEKEDDQRKSFYKG
jgi:RNA polymerase sigma-70 factor (ECF subfamily)